LELVEDLHGTGTLFVDQRSVGKVEYRIRVYRERTSDGAHGAGALDDIRGTLSGLDFLALRDQRVIVQLTDGRAWECVLNAAGRAYDTGRGLRPAAELLG
jgi:hypothetical protein